MASGGPSQHPNGSGQPKVPVCKFKLVVLGNYYFTMKTYYHRFIIPR